MDKDTQQMFNQWSAFIPVEGKTRVSVKMHKGGYMILGYRYIYVNSRKQFYTWLQRNQKNVVSIVNIVTK